jgi:hypothetical protein
VVEEDDPESSPGIKSADVDVDSVGAGGACTASMTSAGPSTPVVQVNVPIVNVRPTERTMEAGKLTIWLTMESTCTPPTWRATVDEMWSAVYRGYVHGSRLSVEVRETTN